MKNVKNLVLSMTLLLTSFTLFAAEKGVKIDVELSPAGSFEIKSNRMRGSVKKTAKGYEVVKGSGIKIGVKTLKTGLELRDDHLHKKMEASKKDFKDVEIVSGMAAGGKGKAMIKIKGITKAVAFTYKENGKFLDVVFPLSLKEYNFKGISYAGVGVEDKVTVHATVPVK